MKDRTRRRRVRALELVIRIDDERALTVVRFEDDGGGGWTLERAEDGAFVPTGDVPEPVRSAAPSQGSALLGLRRVDGFFELAFDGLSPAPSEVTSATLAIIDTSVRTYR